MPNFLLATLLVLVFSLWLRWLPPLGYVELPRNSAQNLRNMVLPALSLSLPLTAILMRMTRSSVLEALGQTHVRVARAKGLRERRVVLRHVLPNAALLIITVAGIQIARLLIGSATSRSLPPGARWRQLRLPSAGALGRPLPRPRHRADRPRLQPPRRWPPRRPRPRIRT